MGTCLCSYPRARWFMYVQEFLYFRAFAKEKKPYQISIHIYPSGYLSSYLIILSLLQLPVYYNLYPWPHSSKYSTLYLLLGTKIQDKLREEKKCGHQLLFVHAAWTWLPFRNRDKAAKPWASPAPVMLSIPIWSSRTKAPPSSLGHKGNAGTRKTLRSHSLWMVREHKGHPQLCWVLKVELWEEMLKVLK